jgi:GAF domain-containing protein
LDPDLGFVGPRGVVPSVPPSGTDASSFLRRVAWLAASAGDFSSAITVVEDRALVTVAASDETAEWLGEAQYATGEGPCLEAISTDGPVDVRDQEQDDRWRKYRLAALDRGVRSSLSLPLSLEGDCVGALNLYDCRGTDGFDGAAKQRAQVFAMQAATAVALGHQVRHHEQMSDQVAAALRARSTIDQALGILMAQEQCDADQAFALLRRHSQNNNQKLRDVATRVVERATGHSPGTASDFETRTRRTDCEGPTAREFPGNRVRPGKRG